MVAEGDVAIVGDRQQDSDAQEPLESVRISLGRHPRRCARATSGDHFRPDVVIEALAAPLVLFIFDINMPVGNGLRVWQKLVPYPGFRAIPIIFLTGRFDQEALAICAMLGARHALKEH